MELKYNKAINRMIYCALGVGLLSGCESVTTKATEERLAELRGNGIDQKAIDIQEKTLQKLQDKDNATGQVDEVYGGNVIAEPQGYDVTQLIAASLENNIDIGTAAQNINRADAQRLNAIFGYLPQIDYTYTQSDITQEVVDSDNQVFQLGTATYPVTTTALEVRQPIFNLSKIYRIKLSRVTRSVAEIEYLAAVKRTSHEIFDLYLKAHQIKKKVDSSKENITLVRDQLNMQSQLQSYGLTSAQVIENLKAEVASLESQVSVESANFSSVLFALSQASGLAISNIQPLSIPSSVTGGSGAITFEEAMLAAEQNNPQLQGLAMSVVEQELARKEAFASDFAPVIDMFYRMEDETREGSRFGGGSQTKETTQGFRATIPIFNAKGQGYTSLVSKVDVRQKAIQYQGVKRQIATEIASVLKRMDDLKSAISLAEQAANSSQIAINKDIARRDAGEASELAVLARRVIHARHVGQVDDLNIEYLRAWGRLQYLTGAKLDEEGFLQ